MLPHKGQCHRPGEGLFQGGQQTPERDALGTFRAGPCGQSGRGGQPGLPNAGRFDVHVRAAQARSERLLRQALGVAGRHPHGATGVSPVSIQLKGAHPMVYTMGRGRKGLLVRSTRMTNKNQQPYLASRPGVFTPPERQNVITPNMVELAQTLTKEQLVAALFPAVQPSAPHEETPASVHRAGSTPLASLV